VFTPLTIALFTGCVVLAALAGVRLARNRLIDDPVVIAGAVLELLLMAQLVVGLAGAGEIGVGSERATFIAYLFTSLVVVPVGIFLAIKEKTRWAMGVVIASAVVVAILVGRLQQIWGAFGA
jgi:hypothetical protein